MLKKFTAQLLRHKKYLLIGLVIVVIAIGGGLALNAKHNSDKRKAQAARKDSANRDVAKDPKPVTYTLVSSDVNCKQAPVTPGSTTTATVCSGKASLKKNKESTAMTYTVSYQTHIYKNGVEQSLDQFSSIPTGQVLRQVSFTGTDKKTLGTVVYFL